MATCRCCDGTGEVEAAMGGIRPCSRCRATDFNRWADERRAEAAAADDASAPQEKGVAR